MIKFLKPEWHDKLSSTNSVLLERLKHEKELPSGFVLATLEQTAGHGRFDRHWISHAGRDLTFSFVLYSYTAPQQLASLSIAVALGAAFALDTFGIQTQTKWPNDLMVGGRKIGGILSERSNITHRDGETIVVGMGINVNMREDEILTIHKPASSICIETGREYAIKDVLDRILETLPLWIDRWEKGGFPAIQDDWVDRCSSVGEHITVGEGKNRKSGTLAGFGDQGQLLLCGDDGVIYDIWAGDVE